MPPVQNVFHILSTCDLKEPVTIVWLLWGLVSFELCYYGSLVLWCYVVWGFWGYGVLVILMLWCYGYMELWRFGVIHIVIFGAFLGNLGLLLSVCKLRDFLRALVKEKC